MRLSVHDVASPCPIAIIGMGCLFPNARNVKEFWHTLRTGRDGITDVPPSHWRAADYLDSDPKRPDRTYCARGGFLPATPFDPVEFGIPPTALEATDTAQLLGLVVAKQAMADAGYGEGREFDRERVSVVLGVTGTLELALPLAARLGHPIWRKALAEAGVTPAVAEEVVARIADGYVPWQENSFPGLLGNVVAGRIANRLNLRGTNCVVDAACASSLSAVHLAMLELAAGRSDVALTGGVDTLNDIFMFMCFSKTPALSPTGDARPFSDEGDGTVIGEGIGMVVLKRLADAQRDGDRIYAVIRAVGSSSDGRSQSIYAPFAAGQARALRNAYRLAGVSPTSVELVEAHGTGTKVGDAVEFDALRTVYREAGGAGTWCGIGSVKSQIGHTKAAAGAAGLIKAALALHHGVLPPTLKVKRPNPKLNIDDSPFYMNTEARPWVGRGNGPRRAAVSSFGFGGSNFHVVMEAAPAAGGSAASAGPAWDGSVQILAASGESIAELDAAVAGWEAAWQAGGAAWAHAAGAARAGFDPRARHRLTVVAETATDVAKLLGQVRGRLAESAASRQTAEPGARAEARNRGAERSEPGAANEGEGATWSMPSAFYSARPAGIGAVAALFPGQGSQFVNMGRDLACVFPEMRAALAEARAGEAQSQGTEFDLADAIYPRPVFDEAAREVQAARLTQTDVAQPALGATALGMWRVLARFGFRADHAAGHSFGELAALAAAGRMDAATLHRLARLRGRLMAEAASGDRTAGAGDAVGSAEQVDGSAEGTMVAVHGPIGEIERVVAAVGAAGVVIANRNAPTQVVLSGPRAGLAAAAAACKARGWRTKALAVGGAFHSGLMAGARGPFRAGLDSAAIEPGTLPVWANATAAPYPAGADAARELLAAQLVSPVRWVEQIEGLYAAGVRTFVEIGPKAVLTGLVGAILGERAHAAVAVDASGGRRCGVADLARVIALLAAQGRGVDLTTWETPVAMPKAARMAVPLTGANYRAPREGRGARGDAELLARAASAVDSRQTAEPGVGAEARNGGVLGREDEVSARDEVVSVRREDESARIEVARFESAGDSRDSRESRLTEGDAMAGAMEGSGFAGGEAVTKPVVSSEAVGLLRDGLRAMQALQQQTAAAHEQFLQGQAAAHQTFARLVDAQMRALGGRAVVEGAEVSPIVANWPAQERAQLTAPGRMAGDGREGARVNSGAASDLVGQAGGHAGPRMASPVEARQTAEPRARTEARDERASGWEGETPGRDEGAAVREAGVSGREEKAFEREEMGNASSRENEVASARGAELIATPVVDGGAALRGIVTAVVSEKTGYPVEMIDLDMDIEADLGIDSIKRVEIVAAIEERSPGVRSIAPEQMGALRTLGQILAYMGGGASNATTVEERASDGGIVGGTAARGEWGGAGTDVPGLRPVGQGEGATRTGDFEAVAVDASESPSVDLSGVLLGVVARLTGYPREMLDLDMDLEADLGIDSIKRVEILAAVEAEAPAFRAVNPEQLGALRTLRQILEAGGGETSKRQNVETSKDESRKSKVESADSKGEWRDGDVGAGTVNGVGAERGNGAGVTAAGILPPNGGAGGEGRGAGRGVSGRATEGASGSGAARSDGEIDAGRDGLTRRVVRLVELPPIGDGPIALAPDREVWITEDGTRLAAAVAAALDARGVAARVVRLTDASWPAAEGTVAGLIVLASPAGSAAETGRVESDVFLKDALRLVQRVAPDLKGAAAAGGALLVGVSRLDGGFGLRGGAFDSVCGGLAGLVKTAAREWPAVRCRALDVSPAWHEDATIAAAMVRELSAAGPIETGLDAGRRRGLEMAEEDEDAARGCGAGGVGGADSATRAENAVSATDVGLRPGDVVVVTGGARGVTAETAVALARRYRPTLVLLGRTPMPEAEPGWLAGLTDEAAIKQAIVANQPAGAGRMTPGALQAAWRAIVAGREVRENLRRIEAAGARVIYRAVDVRDAAALRAVLDDARAAHGPIRGLVHAAGVIEDRRIEDKTEAQFDAVYGTKIDGLRNLLAAANGDDLRCVVLFSSVSARVGNVGQVDYAMANEVLNKIGQRLAAARPTCRVVSLNWGPWAGGMVTPALARQFEQRGVGLIPLAAGAEAMATELSRGGADVEVVIGSAFEGGDIATDVDGGGAHSARAAHGLQPVGLAGSGGAGGDTRTAAKLGGREDVDAKAFSVAMTRVLDDSRHAFLRSHVIGGRPVLPVAMMVEWFAHAALHGHPGLHLAGLDEVRVLKGLALEGGPREIRVLAARARREGGAYRVECELRGGPAGASETTHARASVWLAERAVGVSRQTAEPGARAEARDGSESRRIEVDAAGLGRFETAVEDLYRDALFHGPMLHAIERIDGLGDAGLIARVRTAPRPEAWMIDPARSAWLTDPLAVDGVLQLAIVWSTARLGAPCLPHFVERYRASGAFPATGVVEVTLAVWEATARRLAFDACLRDERGREVARLEGCECTVDAGLRGAFRRGTAADASELIR